MQHNIIAKRIRENLIAQKERLSKYLEVLESEEKEIISKDADKLLCHIEVEKNIIDELNSFKKILEPLEKMYMASPYKKDGSVLLLRESINKITNQVNIKSQKNKIQLDSVIKDMKVNINSKSKINISKNTYGKIESHFVDING